MIDFLYKKSNKHLIVDFKFLTYNIKIIIFIWIYQNFILFQPFINNIQFILHQHLPTFDFHFN